MSGRQTGLELPSATAAGAETSSRQQPLPGSKQRWLDWTRTSTHVLDASLGDSGLINLQAWTVRTVLRPTAAWAALAGLLASGYGFGPVAVPWPSVVLLLLLVDPFWGSLWRLAAGRAEVLALREHGGQPSLFLPYVQPGSAAAKLLDRDTERVMPVLFRVALPSACLALFTASALGVDALVFTVALLMLTVVGWIQTRRRHRVPVLIHSAVSIGLPWLLAVWLLQSAAPGPIAVQHLLLPILWTVHRWGAGRDVRFADERLGLSLMALADIGIGLLLIAAMTPLWLALWLLFSLPTWFLVLRQQPRRRAEFWQLCAMFATAAGLLQGL